jgi:hypothetical protein
MWHPDLLLLLLINAAAARTVTWVANPELPCASPAGRELVQFQSAASRKVVMLPTDHPATTALTQLQRTIDAERHAIQSMQNEVRYHLSELNEVAQRLDAATGRLNSYAWQVEAIQRQLDHETAHSDG